MLGKLLPPIIALDLQIAKGSDATQLTVEPPLD